MHVRHEKPARLLINVVLLTLLAACGGGGGGGVSPAPTPVPISVSISPGLASVVVNATQQFTATVSGSSAGISWSVNDLAGGNATVGTIGASGLYTAPDVPPSPNSVVIKAASLADASKNASATVTVVNPAPVVAAVSPNVAYAGDQGSTITVTGSNFVSASVVQWNGSPRTTHFLSSSQLTALLTAADLATGSLSAITVVNAGPGGGTSSPAIFTINNPAPAITSLFPSPALVATPVPLLVNGTGFVPTSVVQWNGAARATTFVSGTQLSMSLTPSDLASTGTAQVTVFNPTPAGGASAATALPIDNPVPAVAAVLPNSAIVAGAGFTLTVNGSRFVTASTVHWNGSSRTTHYVGGTQLTADIPASDLTTATSGINVSVSTPAPGGGTSNLASFTINNPQPINISASPASAMAGAAGFTLTVNGTNFVSEAVVQWNGNNRPTTFVNSTQLTAPIPATDVAAAGTTNVVVVNPSPSVGPSSEVQFTINNPLPANVSLSPASTTVGASAFTLTVNGSNFVPGAVVQWNGSARTTTFVSSTQLTADILGTDVTAAGTANVVVVNPSPSVGPSAAVQFTINNPQPANVSLSPSSTIAGAAGFTLTVNGSNLVSSSVVQWNGSARTTTFVSSTQLTAAITAGDLSNATVAAVTVFNPTPGGGTSASATFTVNNPQPTTITLSPTNTAAGSGAFILTVNSTDPNFVSTSVVRWNGSDRTTTFVSSKQLTASITAADLATAGVVAVTVFNPAPGGGASNSASFTVNNALPAISMLLPASVIAPNGNTGLALTVNGSSFVSDSIVQWNGSTRATTFVSSTQLTASLTADDVSTGTTAAVTVLNPAPGGGTSNSVSFTVNNPVPTISTLSPSSVTAGTPGLTLTVNGSNFVAGSVVRWNGSARTTTFVSNTRLTATIRANDVNKATIAAVTVFNSAPAGGTSPSASFTVYASGTAPTATLNLFPVNNGSTAVTQTNLSINNDHDNGTSAPDNADRVINGDADKRDMVTLALNVQPWDDSSITSVQLSADNPSLVRVFDDSDNEVTLNQTIDRLRFNAGAINYHAEGLAAGTVIFTLSVTRGGTTAADTATVVVGQQTGIRLTFDDGPDTDSPSLTQIIIDTLATNTVQNSILATFFVETHVSFRGGSPYGRQLITAEAQEGSHVEIHTGNASGDYTCTTYTPQYLPDCDHIAHTERVPYPAYDVTGDGNPDGTTALDSDMIQAAARINSLTGRTPLLVRPPYLEYDSTVLNAYKRENLTMQLVDVDSGDTTACAYPNDTLDCMKNQLTTGVQSFMDAHPGQGVVVLFHDIVALTANNLEELLKSVQKAVRYKGRNEVFELIPDP